MSNAVERLEHINRIHDDEPARAAELLRTLDVADLPAERLRLLAFLVNHVLGEKLGSWREAAARLAPLAGQADATLATLRQYAVAAHCAGELAQAQAACDVLAQKAGVEPELAGLLVRTCALSFAPAAPPAELAMLARRSVAFAASSLDESYGAAFNNATTGLYYATRDEPLTAPLREALQRGADAALVFWLRAGSWMEHERAHYLCAKIALRVGELPAAVAHAERGLAIVTANGDDAVERAFLLQLLAAGVERSGQSTRAAQIRLEAARLNVALDADLQGLLAQDAAEFPAPPPAPRVAFIGGGNLATALIGGLQRDGALAALHVVEVDAARRAQLEREHGATTAAAPDATLAGFDVVVLAVKPQQMREACSALRPYVGTALLLSVAAGIRAVDIARWCGRARVVRAMPNTPSLIGAGISGMAALAETDPAQRALAARIMESVGPVLWFDDEAQLDAVTAVSASGPAYVFRFIEALQQAGRELGFSEAQARTLAIATFTGASALAAQSTEPVDVLRARVTSKGGTTAAALARMEAGGIGETIVAGVRAAAERAREMGDEFGQD